MTLDYQTRAQDFADRCLSGDKLELTYPDRLSLTALLLENGFELEGNADDFEIEDDFNQNREYLCLRKEGERVVGFDRLAPLNLFANPKDSDYSEKQKGRIYTLISGEGDDAYNHYNKIVSAFHDSLRDWRRVQKDYTQNAPDFLLTDVVKGLERDMAEYQAQFDSHWEKYKQSYLPAATFDQEALKKALGVE